MDFPAINMSQPRQGRNIPRRPEYSVKAETMWKLDENVTAARKLPGWREFHRQCGRHNLSFDHIERDGKRGPYKATAFTTERRGDLFANIHVSDGFGKTVLEALADAYRKAEQPVADAELSLLMHGPASVESFDDLLGGDAEVDMEELLG